jgi:hypothetical protein
MGVMHAMTLTAAGAVLLAAASVDVSLKHAEVFEQKLSRIREFAETRSDKPRETPITQDEVNSYLRYKAGDQVPTGVTEPMITIHDAGRLSGRAVVNLDVIRRKGSGGWFDPTSYLTGSLPVTATGVLKTENGRGQFTLERAAVSGVPIPKTFLQELLSYYSRSDDYPKGINMDDPFDLPAEIRRIDVASARAVIVQ